MSEVRRELTRRQTVLLIASLMLGMALAALDATIVGTAMPTIVGQLGGVALYSWVVAAYLLTSTTTVPLYGRLADLYGRKPVFLFGIVVFLIGSALCGLSATMEQLIAFRAVQGLGAGAIQPMAMTIIGDAFGIERRAKMQGFFAAVWGVSSVIGPTLGGLIVTYLSWGWIFYVNVPVGIAAALMLMANYHEQVEHRRRSIDWLGAVLLTAGVTVLLLALQESGQGDAGGASSLGLAAGLLVASLAMLGAFVFVEGRAEEPLVPMALLRTPVIGVGYLSVFLAGATQYGVSSFVPLFVQGAMGGTPLSVGIALFPMTIGWPLGAIAAGRLILRIGYRRVLVAGAVAIALGTVSLLLMRTDSSQGSVMATVALIGLGMGLTSSPVIIAIQNAVSWNQRGIATSLNQFARTIGGSFGIAVMGAVLNLELGRQLSGIALGAASGAAGRTGALVSQMLDPVARSGLAPDVMERVQVILAQTLREVYLIPIACALAGLALIVLKVPAGSVQQLGAAGPGAPVRIPSAVGEGE
jgi:EmrB/QacA subfamily drug resistance transporter